VNKIISKILISLAFVGFFSCQKDDTEIATSEVTSEIVYEQYGVPFDNVPENNDIVLYEVNLRAFSPTGDIQGVINKLDHIQSLGVNVIWLMPIHPIGQINSVNSPYSVKDYKAVSSEYGTLNDLRNLTDAAHSRGIAVIMDWVANHTAWDNPWIENTSWYSQDSQGNIIHPPGTNWLDVADLNYTNSDMRAAMVDAMKFWIFNANIDGFRCDYADGVPFDFWQNTWETINSIPGREFILFAEGSRSNHFSAGFDLSFSWNFYGAIKDVFNGQSVSKIYTAHSNEYDNIISGKQWVRFTTNHDESAWDATPVELFNGIDGALAASVVTIFTGGVPLIYGSQEVGTANNIPFFFNSTINWSNNPDMLEAYQTMLQYYNGSGAAKSSLNSIYENNDVVCFKKIEGAEELLIIVNVRNNTINFAIPSELNSSSWTDVLSQSTISLNDQIVLEPYKFYILSN